MVKQITPFLALLLGACSLSMMDEVGGQQMDRAEPGTLSVAVIEASLKDENAHQPFLPELPLGLGQDIASYSPADNPLTPAKVELGRQLYFDKRLSLDNTVSCATCHDPALGWTDQAPVSTGIDGQKGGRSAPTVVNRVFGKTQFWDGRAASLEEQALGPIANPIEMGFTHPEAVARLNELEGYRVQFQAVFGGPATADGIAKAIAAFERTILSGGNKNDYYEQALPFFDYEPEEGDDAEFLVRMDAVLELEKKHRMSESAERGRELFFDKVKCSQCHVGIDLTDELFHNIGIGMDAAELTPDHLGRFSVSGEEQDKGAFKTPSLRNITSTAPYMHDGSQQTLLEVVEHYNQGGTPNAWLSDKTFPLELTDQEQADLVRFMEEALTGPVTEVEVPDLP
jgi:cytochrome c peroxidase